MAFTSYADIYDPLVIKKLVGGDWLNNAKLVKSTGIIERVEEPVEGTTYQYLRQDRFVDSSGQTVAAGSPIASQKRTLMQVIKKELVSKLSTHSC